MRNRSVNVRTALLATLLAIACGTPPTGPSQDTASNTPRLSIEDAVHNDGNQHFFWLPPMVSNPVYGGTFDAGLSPVVEICEWDGAACVLPLIAQYTSVTGPGSETVRLVAGDELYIVNWHTDQFGLDASKTYRILAKVDGRELGHADVDVVENGNQLKNVDTNEFIPLKDGRTLPIKFRIEEGALPSEITIDASALTNLDVYLAGPAGTIGLFPVGDLITIPNDPGVYRIWDRHTTGSTIPFSINGSGVIDYDAAYDGILAGRGTTALVINGYAYTIDATPLSSSRILPSGHGAWLSSDAPVELVGLPGLKAVQEEGGIARYELTTAGLISYEPGAEAYLDGQGTTTLTVVGYGYTIDATPLSSIRVLPYGHGWMSSEAPIDLVALPGVRHVQEEGGIARYELTAAGLISYEPEAEAYLDGAGTTTLVLVGYGYTMDPTALSSSRVLPYGLGWTSSAAPIDFVALPGVRHVQEVGGLAWYELTTAGLINYEPEAEPYLDGAGTTTLVLVGYQYTIDATALAPYNFSIPDVGSFPPTTPHTLSGLPGLKTFNSVPLTLQFSLDGLGALDYDASLDARVSGRGTATLTILH